MEHDEDTVKDNPVRQSRQSAIPRRDCYCLSERRKKFNRQWIRHLVERRREANQTKEEDK